MINKSIILVAVAAIIQPLQCLGNIEDYNNQCCNIQRNSRGDVAYIDFDLVIHEIHKFNDGTVRIVALGVCDNKSIGIGFRIPPEWKTAASESRFWPKFESVGAPSVVLDTILRDYFRLKAPVTIFKATGYDAVTKVKKGQLDEETVTIRISDPSIERGAAWNFVMTLDIPKHRMQLRTFAPSY